MHEQYGISEQAYKAALAAFHAAVARAPGQIAFANLCRCTQGNISQLIKRGSLLPGRFVPKVSAAYGVPANHLRPDLYPTEMPDVSPAGCHGSVAPGAPIVRFDRGTSLKVAARG